MKDFYDQGKMAVIHGIGYENSPRSHFRSMDIWHTCEPEKVGTEGWVGKVIRELDPNGENVLKGINFGQGLPRAMALRGVPVTSVANLEAYGVLSGVPGITGEQERTQVLERFARMYSPAIGTGPTMDYLGQTGRDALRGADILKAAPEKYTSTVEYADTLVAKSLRDVAQVYLADLGTQVFYTQQGSFDTHFNQPPIHTKLWIDASRAITDFFAISRSTTLAKTWSWCSLPSSAAGSGTTAREPTTAPVVLLSSSATGSRAGCTASTHPSSLKTCKTVTWFPTMTSVVSIPPYWISGWGWTPCR